MQEKAWSTGGLKKLILKLIGENAYCYRKAKNVSFNTDGNTTTFTFEPVRVGKVFIINKTKEWTALLEPRIYNGGDVQTYYYVLCNINYSTFINYKAIQAITTNNLIESMAINVNNVNNNVTVNNVDFPTSNVDEIEIIYENVIYGYCKDV